MDILIGRRFHMQILGHGLGKIVIPLVSDISEQSKFASIARDHHTPPIPYRGVSQNYIIGQIDRRLNRLLVQGISGNKNESVQVF